MTDEPDRGHADLCKSHSQAETGLHFLVVLYEGSPSWKGVR